jgi:hypothetical protein
VSLVALEAPAAEPPPAPWLVVSDLHYSPFLHGDRPSHFGYDTNDALFDSLLAQLKASDPNAPVVILAGDFLAHGFPPAKASATMAYVAERFDQTFPHAQFVITLGNNDSDCGDYESTVRFCATLRTRGSRSSIGAELRPTSFARSRTTAGTSRRSRVRICARSP